MGFVGKTTGTIMGRRSDEIRSIHLAMKNHIFLITICAIAVLTGCHDSEYPGAWDGTLTTETIYGLQDLQTEALAFHVTNTVYASRLANMYIRDT